MTTHCRFALAWMVVCLVAGAGPVVVVSGLGRTNNGPAEAGHHDGQSNRLTVVSAGPTQEVANLAEANEVRVVFSEPMVTLGRIPDPVRPPTILIFTPDPKQPLPLATRFTVTIDTTATAVSGRRLAEPYSFSFTTPTTKLLQTHWYRRGGRADAAIVLLLRFNQPVRPADVAAHLTAAFEPHNFTEPAMSQAVQPRLAAIDPTAVGRFQAKVRQTRLAASARSAVAFRLTDDWDKKAHPSDADLVAFESTTPIPSESWVRVALDARLPSPAGAAVPGTEQSYVVQAEPAFFVDGFNCTAECDPDHRNPLELRREVKVTTFADAVRITDVTAAGTGKPLTKAEKPAPRRDFELDESRFLTIEDAGFPAQPPVRRYEVVVDGRLRAADGQVLGYTWIGQVETWHQRAFTSFGDGHGVWETGGGNVLPFYARNFANVRQWSAALAVGELMPTLRNLQPRFDTAPDGEGTARRLGGSPDRIQSQARTPVSSGPRSRTASRSSARGRSASTNACGPR
jgi:hypothetical protein